MVSVERWGRKPGCRDVSNQNWDRWASIFSLRIASSTLQTDVRLKGQNRFGSAVQGCFCNWGHDGVAPVIRDLGGLEGEIKNAGERRDYVGTQDFKSIGKEFWKLLKDKISQGRALIFTNFHTVIQGYDEAISNGKLRVHTRQPSSVLTSSASTKQCTAFSTFHLSNFF